jgi:hypothetical protein
MPHVSSIAIHAVQEPGSLEQLFRWRCLDRRGDLSPLEAMPQPTHNLFQVKRLVPHL